MNNFNYDKYKPYLMDYVNSITTKSPKNKSNYICPLCGSGSGANGTGAFSLKGNMWKCFSCGEGGDIFDLYKRVNNCDTETAYKGIEGIYDGQTPSPAKEVPSQKETPEEMRIRTNNANMNIIHGLDDEKGKNYFIGRGFSYEAIKKFNLGYMVNDYGYEVVTIPQDNGSYIERYINGKDRYQKGETGLFICDGNRSDILFICEAWADALSLWELGYNSISVNSTNNYRKAIPYAKKETQYKAFVIAFDNDEPGEKASCHLTDDLRKENLNCIKFDYKQMKQSLNDINDFFTGDKEELRKACDRMVLEANKKPIETQNDKEGTNTHMEDKEALKEKFERFSSSHYLMNKFKDDLKECQSQRVSTGYTQIDMAMGGGLSKGLYIVGAVSSLGKTTFILNMSIEIAKQNKHILFFSLEMDEMEMNAKTIARTIAEKKKTPNEREASISAKDIMSQNFKNEKEVHEAKEAVKEIADGVGKYLHFIPCNFDMNINAIQKNIEDFISVYNAVPIVVIDYLQIIPPAKPNASDKQNIDEITRNLKIVQSKYNMIMFVISSFNRESYLLPCDRTSFKESGTLEYSANVMWGLQLQTITSYDYKKLEEKNKVKKREIINKALNESPRKLKMVCLKNRFGESYFEIDLVYYKNCDYFPTDANDQYKEEPKRKRL